MDVNINKRLFIGSEAIEDYVGSIVYNEESREYYLVGCNSSKEIMLVNVFTSEIHTVYELFSDLWTVFEILEGELSINA